MWRRKISKFFSSLNHSATVWNLIILRYAQIAECGVLLTTLDMFYSTFLLFCKKQIFHCCWNGIYGEHVIIFLKYIHIYDVEKWKYNYITFVIMINASNYSAWERMAHCNNHCSHNIEVISWGFMNKKDIHYFMYPVIYNFSLLVRYLKWFHYLILSTVYIALNIFILYTLLFTYTIS